MTKVKLFFSFIIAFACFFLYATSKKSDWFSPSFIAYDKSLWPQVEIDVLPEKEQEKLAILLNQPFYFLGSGNQTFAFVSADEQYVLKFFKFQHLKANQLWSYFKSTESKQKRINQVFSGHALALAKDSDYSGILFAHLNAKESLPLKVTIYDKKNTKHVISLNETVFVIQKKGEPSNCFISRLLNQGKVTEVRQHIRDLLNMYVEEYKRGLFDRDHNVMHNTGFCDDQPIHLDVGKMRQNENMKQVSFFIADLKKVMWERIDKWMKRYYPQFREEIAQEMDSFLNEIELL